jgi:glucose/arabinose dehydrogenase
VNAYYVPGQLPNVTDPNLRVEEVTRALPSFPTNMDFLNKESILVLLKNGEIYHIYNDTLLSGPALKVPVNFSAERGLVGIAINNGLFFEENKSSSKSDNKIFVYYTKSLNNQPDKNAVYKYEWNGSSLVNPELVIEIPHTPPLNHNAGELAIGPDGYLYISVGDYLDHKGVLQNVRNGSPADDTSVILRVNLDNASAAVDNPFSYGNENDSLSNYYAYGIRNSFGLAFDPVTGNLWSTDNGPEAYDEINLIKPGFNGGWNLVKGPISRNSNTTNDLVNINGSYYGDPVFSWNKTIGVTGIDFMKSSKLGDKYLNNLFVGDLNNGNLYFFQMNDSRTGFDFDQSQSELFDSVADNTTESNKVLFGTGFGSITDVKSGPDGFLYIVDHGYRADKADPELYRILRIIHK